MLKEQIAVIATIIINIGLTKFALTAASPRIIPPYNSNRWSNWGWNPKAGLHVLIQMSLPSAVFQKKWEKGRFLVQLL